MKLKLYSIIMILSISLSGLTSCIDRDLCYYSTHPHTGLVKPVFNWKTTEWSTEEIPTEGMSFLFVGEGNTYRHDTIGVYRLMTGEYSSIIYNIDVNASFRNDTEIDKIEAYTDVLGGITSEPGVIFRDMGNFSIYPDDTTSLIVEPKAAVKGINLIVKVNGLDSPSHITGINCFLKGCASGVVLSSLKRVKPSATIVFPMQRVTSGTTDFTARVTTFGALEATGNVLSLDLNLYSGGTVTFPFDLSDYFLDAEKNNMDVINCTLTVHITRLGISTGDTEGDITIDEWQPGTWDSLIKE